MADNGGSNGAAPAAAGGNPSSGSGDGVVLAFQPFSTAIDVSFWHSLGTRKVNEYHLDDGARPLAATYTTGSHDAVPSRLVLTTHAFGADPDAGPEGSGGTVPPFHFHSPGEIHNTNTLEEFKQMDRRGIFDTTAARIWADIESGAAEADPSLLTRWLLTSYADLKKYKFVYMPAMPGLVSEEPFLALAPAAPLADVFSEDAVTALRTEYEALRGLGAASDGGGGSSGEGPAQTGSLAQIRNPPGFFLIRRTGDDVTVGRLSDWDTLYGHVTDGGLETEVTVGFADPCPLATNPGWPLRNFLWLLGRRKGIRRVTVVAYRELPGKFNINKSIVLQVAIPDLSGNREAPPQAVGWEPNSKGKIGPKKVNLASMMDPARLADTSTDLNLKLMRWRLLPSLDVDRLQQTKCLLLGSGTLGCNVARALMGWGVRHITFVDNGRVSYSNPVRQSLFSFEDCLDGGAPKALAAAAALKRIFPSIVSEGHNISIPMPGHAVSDLAADDVMAAIAQLQDLVASHDVVYLLTDTRESRWLPTLLATAMNKTVINTALGFDTYLVMRHGAGFGDGDIPDEDPHPQGTDRLGCYFCNDVVAPTDSMRDRTLDQQCTVTRPGLSFVASALAVELMVGILHHPDGVCAPADSNLPFSQPTARPLGLLPHQVRGFLTHFDNALMVGRSYDLCTACSPAVVREYRARGNEFLFQAFNEPSFLEDLTGLTAMKAAADELEFDWDDDGDDF